MTWFERIMASRPPDFVVGTPEEPYLRRWWLIPRNPVFNVYLHHFLHDDEDRALHDHMYVNLSVLLRGAYREHTRAGVRQRTAGTLSGVKMRLPRTAHRIALINRAPCVTLFITGPRVRNWGFHCPQGWRRWQDFVAADRPGEVGRGCD